MILESADVAVLGAGFAGSLMALVLQRVGRHPVLLERGSHPRFAIGESSTPLANLTLEGLCRTYDLPRLFPLTKYGRWQRTYPGISCGLKRGFSFFQHYPGRAFQPSPDHTNELLVAASPADEIGDTHWFRAEVDHFLVREVQAAGIPYFDRTELTAIEQDRRWRLRGRRDTEDVEIEASFLIDATGPAGLLTRTLGIPTDPAEVGTHSWSVYSHFEGVELWEDRLREMNGCVADHPYRCDAAALHHVLADGWVWVLRFNNGITSAGVAFDGRRHPPDFSLSPEEEWVQVLQTYPSLGRQFARAQAVQPWTRTGRLQRRAGRVAGPDWALLPHAAYFLDPLFSAGIAHTMLGIERLARILEPNKNPTSLSDQLGEYGRTLLREVEFVDWLVHGSYLTFGRFDLLSAYTMYYFAGAVQSEERRLRGTGRPEDEFLFSHHPPLRAALKKSYDALLRAGGGEGPSPAFADDFFRQIARDIAPINPAGFCDRAKHNMYPYVQAGPAG
jgi:FADH2 O2-dependent halogenase